MQNDTQRREDTRAWFRKARVNLQAAAHHLTAEPPLTVPLVFHCQQAVEKAFKGFLTWHDRRFRKTHSLEELGEQCLSIDNSLGPLVDRVAPLTEYAWAFRYPIGSEPPSREEAEAAMSLAREAWDVLTARLPGVVA
jgi:HEPN domain-containing protein